MSLLKEINYTDYIANKVEQREYTYIKNNVDEYNYLKEDFDATNYMYAVNPQYALRQINNLYEKNFLYLNKQPWADLLIQRIRIDIKNGFCKLVVVDPDKFVKFLRMIRPVLALFSKAHIFTQTLNDLDNLYETSLAGCYSSATNKIYIVCNYIEQSKLNLDTFKVILHEYCHYYARRKHKKYVELFKNMCLAFYTKLVDAIYEMRQDDVADKEKRIKLVAAILDGAFHFKNKRHMLRDMLDRMWSIDPVFAQIYFKLLIARRDYLKDDPYFRVAEEILLKAYSAICGSDILNHINKFNFSYQEFYCADEVVAIMSYYTPNKKPYLEMLRSL